MCVCVCKCVCVCSVYCLTYVHTLYRVEKGQFTCTTTVVLLALVKTTFGAEPEAPDYPAKSNLHVCNF